MNPLDQLKQNTIAEFREKFKSDIHGNLSCEHEITPTIEEFVRFLTQAIEEAWEAGRAEQRFPPDHAYCISRGFDVCEHTGGITSKN